MRKYTIHCRYLGFTVPDPDDIRYVGRQGHRNRVPFTEDDQRTIEVPNTARLLANGEPSAELARQIDAWCWREGADPAELDPDTVQFPEHWEWVTGREILAIEEK